MKHQKKFEEIKKCDLCGSVKTKIFLIVPDRNYITGTFTYVQCNRCKLIRLSPRPELRYLTRYYPSVYYPYKKLTLPTSLQKIIRALFAKYPLIASFFIRDQLFSIQPKGKLLDVGTGNGAYLLVLKEWGWYTYGVELSNFAVIRARKAGIKNIFQGTIFTTPLQKNYFDVIRFSHVMEHVPSPTQELIQTHKLLKKNGRVIILIPNIASLFFRLFRSYWYPLEPPRHFHQFTPTTIKALLTKTGFSHIQVKYNQSPYPILWSLKYLFGQRQVEKKIGFFSYPLGLVLRPINFFKASDIIEVTAYKNRE